MLIRFVKSRFSRRRSLEACSSFRRRPITLVMVSDERVRFAVIFPFSQLLIRAHSPTPAASITLGSSLLINLKEKQGMTRSGIKVNNTSDFSSKSLSFYANC